MTDQYAVIGNPVAHSKSPVIHAEFARQTGQDLAYSALFAPRDGFVAAVMAFRDAGGKGLNVTLPFKHEAWRLAGELDALARQAGAVNTLKFGNGKITGFNTDGIGLVRDLQNNLDCELKGMDILLMGAGGASYGVVEPLLRERPRRLVTANRTINKAHALVAHFDSLRTLAAAGISASSYDALAGSRFDLIINATSAGLANAMPPLPADIFASGALAYDMVYGATTPFLQHAEERGVRVADGTGMLVEQAAESFFIWRGVRPETAPVIALLKKREQ
jgi:shikimate dehydrogenase